MRWILATAALSVVLLAGTGCDADRSGTTGGGTNGNTSASPGATSGGTTGSGDTSVSAADKQVCADSEKLITESTQKFTEELVKAMQSGGQDAALTAVKTLFTDWASGLRTQAGKATNANLKSALNSYADGLDKVNAQIKNFGDLENLEQLNTPEIETATDKITQICG